MLFQTRYIFVLLILASMLGGCEKNTSHPTLFPGSVSDTASTASPEKAIQAAEILTASGAHNQALHVLADAYHRFPRNSRVISAYGRLAFLNGQTALARRLLHEAIAVAPDDWRALSALGVLESQAGNILDARNALARAKAASNENAVALNNLAMSALLDGKPERAIPLLTKALASPELRSVHRKRIKHNMGLALAMQGRYVEAELYVNPELSEQLQHMNQAEIRRLIGEDPSYSKNSWAAVVEPAGS